MTDEEKEKLRSEAWSRYKKQVVLANEVYNKAIADAKKDYLSELKEAGIDVPANS